MITKVNFKTLLETLSFNANTENSIFTKIINGYELKVDFTDEKLIYPEGLVVNELQTSNFLHLKILWFLNACIACLKKVIPPNALN